MSLTDLRGSGDGGGGSGGPAPAIEGVAFLDDPSAVEALPVRTLFDEEALLVACAGRTIEAAGLQGAEGGEGAGLDDTALVAAVDTVVDGWKADYFAAVVEEGPLGASPLVFPYTSPNALAARLSIVHGLRGESLTVTSGPLSFLKALVHGRMLVETGRAARVLCAAVAEGSALTLLLSARSAPLCLRGAFESGAERRGEGRRLCRAMGETFAAFLDACGGGRALMEFCDDSGRGVTVEIDGRRSGLFPGPDGAAGEPASGETEGE